MWTTGAWELPGEREERETEGGKRVAGVVVLLVLIVLVLGFTMKKQLGIGGARLPEQVKGRKLQKIGMKTNKVVGKTVGEWEKLGHKDGRYKNTETGDYTMVVPITCGSCDEQIPRPEVPEEAAGPGDVDTEHICPLCEEPAHPWCGGRRTRARGLPAPEERPHIVTPSIAGRPPGSEFFQPHDPVLLETVRYACGE